MKRDTIALDQKIFTEFEKGELHKAELHDRQVRPKVREPQIIYRKGKGHLSYDADGDGRGEALKFANIGKHKDITHDDFLVI